MNKIDLAYTAGFFDSEGCIVIAQIIRKSSPGYHVYITVPQCGKLGEQLLLSLKENFKGKGIVRIKTEKRLNRSKSWIWQTEAQQTYQFLQQVYPYLKLKQVYPYLKLKKEQANLAMEFQEKASKHRLKTHPSDTEKTIKFCYCETVKQEISFLNNKHKKE